MRHFGTMNHLRDNLVDDLDSGKVCQQVTFNGRAGLPSATLGDPVAGGARVIFLGGVPLHANCNAGLTPTDVHDHQCRNETLEPTAEWPLSAPEPANLGCLPRRKRPEHDNRAGNRPSRGGGELRWATHGLRSSATCGDFSRKLRPWGAAVQCPGPLNTASFVRANRGPKSVFERPPGN